MGEAYRRWRQERRP